MAWTPTTKDKSLLTAWTFDFDEKQLTYYRRDDVGFVFQFYNLVPNLTAKENVELAAEIVKTLKMQRKP